MNPSLAPRTPPLLRAAFAAVVACSPAAATAGNHGFWHHSQTQYTSGYLVPSAVTPVVATSGVAVSPMLTSSIQAVQSPMMVQAVQSPMMVQAVQSPMMVQAVQSPMMVQAVQSPMMVASVPVYAAQAGVANVAAANTASALLQPVGAGAGASPMLGPAGTSQIAGLDGAGGSDYVAEYNAFLLNENAANPAGLLPAPSDVALLSRYHPALTGALGANRLGSLGRFLVTKLKDPNFRANAIALFKPILGTFFPQFSPLVNAFLDHLQQSGQGPAVALGGGGGGGAGGGAFAGLAPGRYTFDVTVRRDDDGAPEPPVVDKGDQAGADVLKSLNPTLADVIAKAKAKVTGIDPSTGIVTVTTADGQVRKFKPDGTLLPPGS